MVAVATGISLGGGNLRYRVLMALPIPSVLVVSAVCSGASADDRRISPAGDFIRASKVRGGAYTTTVIVEGAGFYHAMPERRERQKHERARG
jgi:hypothetical protein